MYIVGKYKIDLHMLQNRLEKLNTGLLFYLFLKLVQINLIFSDKAPTQVYIYIYRRQQHTFVIILQTIKFGIKKNLRKISDQDYASRSKSHRVISDMQLVHTLLMFQANSNPLIFLRILTKSVRGWKDRHILMSHLYYGPFHDLFGWMGNKSEYSNSNLSKNWRLESFFWL
jgi:hypothetical protein